MTTNLIMHKYQPLFIIFIRMVNTGIYNFIKYKSFSEKTFYNVSLEILWQLDISVLRIYDYG